MAKKMITAKDILAEKGFQQNRFDTKGFNELVANFFLEHSVAATVMLVPRRFVAMSDAPECGYIDMTDTGAWIKRVEDPNDPLDFTDYLMANRKGLIRPMIYVDEPFIKNAAHLLTLMGGFVVKKQGKGKFLVSLV